MPPTENLVLKDMHQFGEYFTTQTLSVDLSIKLNCQCTLNAKMGATQKNSSSPVRIANFL